jgi:hypothetical protein
MVMGIFPIIEDLGLLLLMQIVLISYHDQGTKNKSGGVLRIFLVTSGPGLMGIFQ